MNLLNKLFDFDELEMMKINKKYFIIFIFIFFVILLLLIIKKNNYYINTFTIVDNNIILLVEKDFVNEVKNNKEIIINDIKSGYSINKITIDDDFYLISINLNTKIENIKNGKFKIYIGKESLFDFIIRIIKK